MLPTAHTNHDSSLHHYLNHIYQVVNSAVFFQQDISVVTLVLLQSTIQSYTVICMKMPVQ